MLFHNCHHHLKFMLAGLSEISQGFKMRSQMFKGHVRDAVLGFTFKTGAPTWSKNKRKALRGVDKYLELLSKKTQSPWQS